MKGQRTERAGAGIGQGHEINREGVLTSTRTRARTGIPENNIAQFSDIE